MIEQNHEECCGFEFEKNKFPFWGLLTFAYPLLLITFPLKALYGVRPMKAAIFVQGAELHQALTKLIRKQSYFPALKCELVAKTLKPLPSLSHFIFRWFNVLVLTLTWGLIFFLCWFALWII